MQTSGRSLLAGLVYSMITMGAATLLLSLFLLWTNMKEEALEVYILVIHVLALFVGGFAAGRRKGEKGWLNGGFAGLIYALFIVLIGFLGFDDGFDWMKGFMIAAAFIVGAFGGIFGVNFRK